MVEEEEDKPFWEKELTPETALPYLVEGLQVRSETFGGAWKELYTWYRKHPKWHAQMEQLLAANHLKRPHDQLSEEVARKLYGTILENSVTRLEKFSACALSLIHICKEHSSIFDQYHYSETCTVDPVDNCT